MNFGKGTPGHKRVHHGAVATVRCIGEKGGENEEIKKRKKITRVFLHEPRAEMSMSMLGRAPGGHCGNIGGKKL